MASEMFPPGSEGRGFPHDLGPVGGDIEPMIELVDDPLAEWVSLGERYWALDGVDAETSMPRWRHRLSALAEESGIGSSVMWAMTGLAVRVVCHGHTCQGCGHPAQLRARQHLVDVLKGKPTEKCARCSSSYREAVALQRDPQRAAQRQSARLQRQHDSELANARAEWRRAQRSWISERYHRQRRSWLTDDVPDLPVAVAAAALAAIRHAPQADPIPEEYTWPAPLTPSSDWTAELLGACHDAGVLEFDPSTRLEEFVWDVAFEDAWRQGRAVGDDRVSPSAVRYSSRAMRWQPRVLGSDHVTSLDTELSARLSLDTLSPSRQLGLIELVQQLIAHETVRYFDARLLYFNLPAVSDNHRAKLTECAMKLAAHRTLGQAYRIASTAAFSAAATAQRITRAPAANMTVHAINRFETSAQEASAGQPFTGEPFRPDATVPLSAMTRLVFYGLLDMPPMSTSVSAAESVVQGAARAPKTPTTLSECIDALMPTDSTTLLSNEVIMDALKQLANNDATARAGEKLTHVADEVALVAGDPMIVAIAVLAAASVLSNDQGSGESQGDLGVANSSPAISDLVVAAITERRSRS